MDVKVAQMPNTKNANMVTSNYDDSSTTTISTIVVRAAPHSTIIIAILKSFGYVQLRIDEMKPSLLELGNDLAETTRLIDMHKDLCTRLASKNSQVNDLLSRADSLPAAQSTSSDALVYAAMAESLNSAWRELTRQLELRGFLLDETRHFFELAERHENTVESTSALIRDKSNGTRFNVDDVNLNTVFEQIKHSVNELAKLTAEVADVGADIISHIRTLGKLSDNEQRLREIVDACVVIENIMLKLANRWETIDELWDNERSIFSRLKINTKQDVNVKEEDLNARLNAAAAWLDAARQTYNTIDTTTDVGNLETRRVAATLLQELNKRNSELTNHDLATSNNVRVNLLTFCENLQHDYKGFQTLLQEKLDIADRLTLFFVNSQSVLGQLKKMTSELRAADATASMAGELGPLAYQKVGVQFAEGEEILRLKALLSDMETRERIDAKLEALQIALHEVDKLAKDKIQAAKTLNSKVQTQIAVLMKWLIDSPEAFLTSKSGELSVDRQECVQFVAQHKKVYTELTAHEPELKAILGHAQELATSDRKRCFELQRLFDNIRDILEDRLTLARNLEQFQKFSRDVDASLNAARQLVNAPASTSVLNTSERLRTLQHTAREALQREKHHGEKFVSEAQSTAQAARIKTTLACTHVKMTILEHEKQLVNSLTQTDNWQSAKHAEQNIYQTIKEVTTWEREIEQLIHNVEDHLQKYALAAADTSTVLLYDELEYLNEKRAEYIRQIVEALERLPQINRKSCEVRDAAAASPVFNALTLNARLFIERQRDAINVKEPLAPLQIRLVRLREEIRKQTMLIETRIITSKEMQQTKCAPCIIKKLEKVELEEGSPFEFVAEFHAGEPPATNITWLRDGLPITKSNYQTIFSTGQAILRIAKTFVEDTALYTLRVVNDIGTAETSARLNIKPKLTSDVKDTNGEKPRFIRELQNVIATEGAPIVTLECIVIGTPEPKVIWYKEEECIRESDRIKLRFVNDQCALDIYNVGFGDSGLYKMQTVNNHGECVSFCRLNVIPASPTRSKVPPFTPPKPTTLRTTVSNSRSNTTTVVYSREADRLQKPPTFDIPLANQLVNEGERVLLQVHIAGDTLLPQITWYLNDKLLFDTVNEIRIENDEKSGFARLHIHRVTPHLTGIYTVVARNAFGEVHSAATLSLANASSMISTMTTSGYFEEYNTHRLPGMDSYSHNELALREYGEMTPQPYRNRQRDRSSSVTSSAAPSTQPSPRPFTQSPYAPSLSREFGDMGYSSIANAPEFIRPLPAEYTVDEGESAVIDCLLVGNPRPRVYWTFNDRPLKSNHLFVELTNVGDTYAINFAPARLEHAGYYRMTAENVRGKTKSLTLVHVRPRSIIAQPTAHTGRKTQSFEQQRLIEEFGIYGGPSNYPTTRCISAFPSGALRHNLEPSSIQQPYYRPQPDLQDYHAQAMSTSAYQPEKVRSPEYGSRSISVARMGTTVQNDYDSSSQHISQHQSMYDETAKQQYDILNVPYASKVQKNTGKSTVKEISQTVIDKKSNIDDAPPHFKQTLVSCVVCVGDAAKFDVIVNGSPKPALEWFKNGEPLILNQKEYPKVKETAEERVELIFDAVRLADAGKYMCSAQNASGMATSSAQLVVRPKTTAPDFVKRLISEEVMEGEHLKWTVSIVGDPQPRVVWLRDGKPIPNCEDVRLVQESPTDYTMIIERVEAADAGQFTCLLENEAGEARSTADLVVRPAGSQPGSYFHITKVTQEKQLKGEEISQSELICMEESPET